MPLVFLGSLAGVILGKLIGEKGQIILFGLIMCWSIYTSYKKATELAKKEKASEEAAKT
jgi:hypothetical protein